MTTEVSEQETEAPAAPQTQPAPPPSAPSEPAGTMERSSAPYEGRSSGPSEGGREDRPPFRRGGGGGGGRGRGGGGRRKVCAFCVDKIDHIDYKEPHKLRRFVSERGKIEPRRKTGTCARHQRKLTLAIKRARHLALLPYTADHKFT